MLSYFDDAGVSSLACWLDGNQDIYDTAFQQTHSRG